MKHIKKIALAFVVMAGLFSFAAERVDFAHDVPLAGAADGRVARHERDGVQAQREQEGGKAHARTGERGFAARVSCTYDDDVK